MYKGRMGIFTKRSIIMNEEDCMLLNLLAAMEVNNDAALLTKLLVMISSLPAGYCRGFLSLADPLGQLNVSSRAFGPAKDLLRPKVVHD